MKIAIAGAGLTGAYLYRLLKNDGYDDITVFDRQHDTKCGINPCAWGVSLGFEWMIERAGLDPVKYALRDIHYAVMGDMNVKVSITTINKPALIKDLLEGAEVKYGLQRSTEDIGAGMTASWIRGYDRVIDATGAARAFLPPIKDDVLAPTYQYRVSSNEPADMHIKLGKIGYAWKFPLSGDQHHIGASSLIVQPWELLGDKAFYYSGKRKVLCSCEGKIRATGPRASQPFVSGNVWGVGEAIGVVAPLAGYGIVPGLQSARILRKYIEAPEPDPVSYVNEILKEFSWMDKEPAIIEKMKRGKNINIFDAWTLKQNSKHVGMDLGIFQALRMLKKWR